MQKLFAIKKLILLIFLGLGILSVFLLGDLKFSFDFSQFFPEGDEDVAFYQKFSKEFGADDSFLLIAVENEGSVFEKDFLDAFHQFSLDAKKMMYVKESQSLTTLSYPLKTTLGYTKLPVIHRDAPNTYASDWEKIQEDGLFVNALIDSKATSLVLALETEDVLDYKQCIELLTEVRQSLATHQLNKYHLLGRAYFYETLINLQKRELTVSTICSTILVFFIIFLIYRKVAVVFISLFSILFGLLLFMGLLSALGIELNSMAAFYPLLMVIVGTSDVVHIMDDYLGKLKSGLEKQDAMILALKEVGVSTLLTSVTTAIGFASLLTSKSSSISGFGLNAALGVLTAYVTVIFLTCSLLLLCTKEQLISKKTTTALWQDLLQKINVITIKRANPILYISLVFMLVCFWGMFKINTNYQIKSSFPRGSQIAVDFNFFQKEYAGFRPFEVAVITKEGHKVTDWAVVREIEKVERHMKTLGPIRNVQSANTLYKGLNKAYNLNKSSAFVLPKDSKTFDTFKKDVKKLARKQFAKFVTPDEKKARISSKILDVGLDSTKVIYERFNTFVDTQTDSSMVKFKLTGTGILLDKNSFYVRESLIHGLLLGLILVALLMALLFKNLKLVLISLLPNLLPLLFAAALLGFFGIPLEATVSVVFAIVFGIAVDDTIHFLGRYKIGISKGLTKEEALKVTFAETGRALIITTLILFFGFLVLLFSIHTPSITIGLLVSVTLLAALLLDLLLLPVLIRKLL